MDVDKQRRIQKTDMKIINNLRELLTGTNGRTEQGRP